ncbi:MAG TPA: iron ABC transporter permease [Chloroflexota bacterium]|nr:iron ABC transporter permease [Chloroflexota bacterium]
MAVLTVRVQVGRSRLSARPVLIAGTVTVLSFVVIYPIVLLLINSFVLSRPWQTPQYGLDAWRFALLDRSMIEAMRNTLLLALVHQSISLPIAIVIAWLLGRTDIPGARALEFFFWVAFFLPIIPTVQAWILLLDPNYGLVNALVHRLPFVPAGAGPFNIFSFWGIVWMHLVTSTIAIKVMLFTPAFRNLDASLEEASTVSGASALRTLWRVTVPALAPALATVMVLALVRAFQAVEIELILGMPVGLFVFGSKIFDLTREEPPFYGAATAMGTYVMLLMVPLIIVHRRLTSARQFTTITSSYKPQPTRLRGWRWPAFGFVLVAGLFMTLVPVVFLLLGSFMKIYGVFEVPDGAFTVENWSAVLGDPALLGLVRNTLSLAVGGATLSVALYSTVAYVLVRWRFPLRDVLDTLTWIPAALPGILLALAWFWIFLRTPILNNLAGSIWALILVSGLSGMTLAVQLMKAGLLQLGPELEEASQVAGASWLTTARTIVVPLFAPTMVVLWVFSFVVAASNAILPALLASPASKPLALRQLEFVLAGDAERSSIIGIMLVILSIGVAVIARLLGFRVGLSRVL